MLFPEKTITLKNGKTAILRSPKPEEAAEMLEYLRDVSGETHFVLREVEECTETLEQETAFLGLKEQMDGEHPGAALLHGITGSGKTAGCIDKIFIHPLDYTQRFKQLLREFFFFGSKIT